MERITKRVDEDHACYAICEKECPDGIYADNPACVCTASKMAMKRLLEYEDTGLTPEQIRELKERDTAKAPKIHKNKHSNAYTCPNCNLVLINKDETGWFCGKHYNYCPDCGQRLKWEE